MTHDKIYKMEFSRIYPLLVNKAEKKGRTRAEVDQIISWLTGYPPEQIAVLAGSSICYGEFFRDAPAKNPDRLKITGTVCGVRVEKIEDEFLRDVRCLDKLVDELAKGKPMNKILIK